MPYRITIKPSNNTFDAQPDDSVLEAALREGFVLAYSCRNGACGTCKGKVLEGSVDYGVYQPETLPEAEKAQGYALFCQAKPLSDLVVECREISAVKDIQVRTLPCRVQKMDKLAADVMRIQLKLPANERLQFLAGQYIDILMRGGMRRSLSMANPPHDDALMELHLRNYGGPFSEHVFNKMKEKEILRFEGPLGTFFLRDESAKPIIFVASGTGFVHRAVMEDFPEMTGYQVYACGAPVMVEAAHKDFMSQRGLPEGEFYSDAFTPAAAPAQQP